MSGRTAIHARLPCPGPHSWRRALSPLLMWLVFVTPTPVRAAVTTIGCALTDFACTMSELIAGGEIQVSDKRFSSWEIERDPGSIDYDLVLVEGDEGPTPGLRFLGNGELSIADGDFLDWRFGFVVTVTDPQNAIVGAELSVASAEIQGTANVSIDETLFAIIPRSKRGELHARVDPLFEVFDYQDDLQSIGNLSSLFVEKEIYLEGGGPGDRVELKEFSQHLIQLPEPDAAYMLLVGWGLLVALNRKRAAGI